MVRPVSDDKLMLHALYYADEVRTFDEVPAGKPANDRELALATQLIRTDVSNRELRWRYDCVDGCLRDGCVGTPDTADARRLYSWPLPRKSEARRDAYRS